MLMSCIKFFKIVFSGCNLPFCSERTFEEFNSEVEEDLKQMLELIPNCVDYNEGY